MTRSGLPPAEAAALILAAVNPMPVERVPLMTALGAFLAENVFAVATVPPWRSASMDGYAVRAADIDILPASLRVIGETVAGAAVAQQLAAGQAVKIMTGAPVPQGADTVVRVEDTTAAGGSVQILGGRDRLRNVRPLGEDFRNGDLLVRAGTRITPAAIGVLASTGVSSVAVRRAPTVSIVSSGDELVRVDEFAQVVAGERIVSSNSYSLPALVRDAGGTPRDGGITADDPTALRAAIDAAIGSDLLLTSGGVSVGDRDFTRRVMSDMGADIKFWRARVRPGGPIAFGTLHGRPWIGLPGNPVSAMVTFELFVRPAILKMLGEDSCFPMSHPVVLDEPVTVSGDLTHYLRVVVSAGDAGMHVRLTGTQSSAALTSMMRANALLIVPEGRREYLAGETLRAIPLGCAHYRTATFPS
ncbi:MAG: molybdopterin molybdotransferase MoeA [Gemmatimonadota bacterium]|nr:molybdopterin molybdotransferase MoeA [Gemmatimonadota bacterium]